MSTRANPKDTDVLMSNDPLMEEFHRGQRSAYLKGVIALVGVAAAVALFLLFFTELATV